MEPEGHEDRPEPPPSPTLWPVGFAVGVAILLVGIVVSTVAAIVGAAIAAVFAFLWIRDLTTEHRKPVAVEPEEPEPVAPPHVPEPEPGERFPRSKFLEGATLGLGAAIGAIVTVPALGFTIVPAFVNQKRPDVDLGPLAGFPEGKFIVATFMDDAEPGRGLAAHRVRAEQRPAQRRPQLHGDLEPLCAPRLPGPAQRPALHGADEEGEDRGR